MHENESALLLLRVQESTSNCMKALAVELKKNPSLDVLQPAYNWFYRHLSKGLEAGFQTDLNASVGSEGTAWTVAVFWSNSRWTVDCLVSKLNLETGDESVTELFSEEASSLDEVEQLRAYPNRQRINSPQREAKSACAD